MLIEFLKKWGVLDDDGLDVITGFWGEILDVNKLKEIMCHLSSFIGKKWG